MSFRDLQNVRSAPRRIMNDGGLQVDTKAVQYMEIGRGVDGRSPARVKMRWNDVNHQYLKKL